MPDLDVSGLQIFAKTACVFSPGLSLGTLPGNTTYSFSFPSFSRDANILITEDEYHPNKHRNLPGEDSLRGCAAARARG